MAQGILSQPGRGAPRERQLHSKGILVGIIPANRLDEGFWPSESFSDLKRATRAGVGGAHTGWHIPGTVWPHQQKDSALIPLAIPSSGFLPGVPRGGWAVQEDVPGRDFLPAVPGGYRYPINNELPSPEPAGGISAPSPHAG